MRACSGFIISLLFWLPVSSIAGAQTQKKTDPPPRIRIVTSEAAPYNFLKNGRPTGVCTEIVQGLLRDLGITAPITTLPWARAYKTAETLPNTLIYTIIRSKDREDRFHWIGVIATGRAYLFSLRSRKLRFSSLDQTRPFTIGTTRGDLRTSLLTQKGMTNLDLVADSRMNAIKLLKQRIDLWAENELTAVHIIRSLGHDPNETLTKSFPLSIDPEHKGYLAFSRGSDPRLVDLFTKALNRFKQSDAFHRIQQRYSHLAF